MTIDTSVQHTVEIKSNRMAPWLFFQTGGSNRRDARSVGAMTKPPTTQGSNRNVESDRTRVTCAKDCNRPERPPPGSSAGA